MENNLKISVVTVCYNAVETLEETMLSVLNQTYPNVEYIIIDGGSTDGTVDIIKKYANSLAYWVSEPDKGIYDAMNKGIDAATGDYINFMNAGDSFYEITTINDVCSSMSLDKRIDVYYGDTLYNYDYGSLIVYGLQLVLIEKRLPFCHQSSFVKSEVMRNTHFDLNYKYCADYNFFYNLYKNQGSIIHIPIVIAKYEATSGISSRYVSLVYREKYKIWGITDNLFKLFVHEIDLFKIIIRDKLRRILPKRIVLKIQKNRIRKRS